MPSLTILKPLCLFSPLLALACSTNGLDLGGPDEITASSDPTVLGTIQEEVAQIRVDGERLYWLGSGTTRTAYANGGGQEGKAGFPQHHPWALRSCQKDDCAATRVTYAPDSVDAAAGFGIHDGFVFWFQLVDLPGGYPTYEQLLACEIAFFPNGCLGPFGGATPLLPLPRNRSVAVFDGDTAYFIRDAGNATEIVSAGFGTASTPDPQTVASVKGRVLTLAAQDDYVYWLSAPDAAHPSANDSIQRTLKDGSGQVEQLADNIQTLERFPEEDSYPTGGLALDATYIYWVDATSGGGDKRCPLAGCNGQPDVLASPVAPLALLIDAGKVFWSSRSDDYSYSLASCVADDCSSFAPVVEHLETAAAVAADEQYLYAATNDLETPFLAYNGFGFVNSLRRFPK